MSEAEIRKYAGLMQELGLTGLEITQADQVVRLERNLSVPPAAASVIPVPAAPAEPVDTGETISRSIQVTSPIVGVFYAAPTESAAPYVALGDRVKKGQTLCIVEAMKLMNEIAAEEEGVIAEICAANGQVVEYGTPLFRIRRC